MYNFFGDAAERAWVGHNNLLEFQGKVLFDDHVEELYKATPNKREKARLQKWYGVPPARAKAVNIGVQQAEEALPLSRNDRKAKFTFLYQSQKSASKQKDIPPVDDSSKTDQKPDNKSKNSDTAPAKKRKLEESATPEASKSKRRKVETPVAADNDTDTKKKAITPVSRPVVGTEASFDVFVQKERDNVVGRARGVRGRMNCWTSVNSSGV